MKKIILILMIIIGIVYISAERSESYIISDPVEINTMMGATGYAVSGLVSINTMEEEYTSYRIVPVAMATNPEVIEVQQDGVGYAWFVAEGLLQGNWLPIMVSDVLIRDEQNNMISGYTSDLPYLSFQSLVHLQNLGVFAVPVNSSQIGNGNIGDVETFTVYSINDVVLEDNETAQSNFEVIPKSCTVGWSYRIGLVGGAGLEAGVASATANLGGGTGSVLEIDVSENGSWDYDNIRIKRQVDINLGVEGRLGPPKLGFIQAAVTAQAGVSFPYSQTLDFDVDEIEGLEGIFSNLLLIRTLRESKGYQFNVG